LDSARCTSRSTSKLFEQVLQISQGNARHCGWRELPASDHEVYGQNGDASVPLGLPSCDHPTNPPRQYLSAMARHELAPPTPTPALRVNVLSKSRMAPRGDSILYPGGSAIGTTPGGLHPPPAISR
jgi:hypothetical protein